LCNKTLSLPTRKYATINPTLSLFDFQHVYVYVCMRLAKVSAFCASFQLMRKLLGLTSIFQMCSVNNRDDIFETTWVIPIETVCLNVAWSARLGQVLPR